MAYKHLVLRFHLIAAFTTVTMALITVPINLGSITITVTMVNRSGMNTINMTSKDITFISANAFERVPNLQVLRLSRNNISFIAPEAFSGTLLSILRVPHNNLDHIPDLSAVRDTLTEIHAQHNRISQIYNLEPLQKLEKVYLNNNLLAPVPHVIHHQLGSERLFVDSVVPVSTKFMWVSNQPGPRQKCTVEWDYRTADRTSVQRVECCLVSNNAVCQGKGQTI